MTKTGKIGQKWLSADGLQHEVFSEFGKTDKIFKISTTNYIRKMGEKNFEARS